MYLIAGSAGRHGIADEGILHAARNAIATEDLGEGLTMFIGPARDANLVEVGVVDGEDGPVIVHAMVARSKYLRRKGDR